jgi:hypothetical protein
LTWSGGNNGGFSVIQTSDGGYAFSGWTYKGRPPGLHDALVKVDANGELKWMALPHRIYLGNVLCQAKSGANCVVQTSDGGYIMISEEFPDSFAYVTKIDANGYRVWDLTFDKAGIDLACSLIATANGDVVVAGCTTSSGAGGFGMWLLKIDPNPS